MKSCVCVYISPPLFLRHTHTVCQVYENISLEIHIIKFNKNHVSLFRSFDSNAKNVKVSRFGCFNYQLHLYLKYHQVLRILKKRTSVTNRKIFSKVRHSQKFWVCPASLEHHMSKSAIKCVVYEDSRHKYYIMSRETVYIA